MSQTDLQEELSRAVEGAIMRDVDLEEIDTALTQTQQRLEEIAGMRGEEL